MIDKRKVADEADMIVNGYAFTKCVEGYRVLNLNRPDKGKWGYDIAEQRNLERQGNSYYRGIY